MFTDSHCHLFKTTYANISSVLKEASSCGVIRVISSGYNLLSSKEALNNAIIFDNYYCTLGIHPENWTDNLDQCLKYIEENINNPKVVAIGEIGLDYFYTKDNKQEQIEIFEKQLSLAQKYNKPVVIHTRDAIEETYEILKKYKLKGVIHSFTGSYEMAIKFIGLGYLIGVNGVITFKNCKLKEVIKKIPLNDIVLETDSPYLTPEPYRGKTNNPSHIVEIANFLTQLYGVSEKNLAKITNDNIKRIFDI